MKGKKIWLWVMAAFYIAAGVNHFINPGFYERIMPSWVPAHHFLILLSGAFEILFGMLLLPVLTRKLAAWAIIILLVAVFPANIQMMINYRNEDNPLLWVAIARLPIQLLLIAWAYRYTRPVVRA